MDTMERFEVAVACCEASAQPSAPASPTSCGHCRQSDGQVGPLVHVQVAHTRLCPACFAAFASARRTVGEPRLLPAGWVRPKTEAGGRVPPLPPQP